ncbi:MAG: VWA domain-containing protein [Nonomuraea sp.]|nr:VWA domain-containing protein [Nonomuraea sp.]
MASLIDRVKMRMQGSGFDALPPQMRQKSRRVVKNANRFDDLAYKAARSTDKVGDLVHELMEGDKYEGGDREEFDRAPELVEAVFHLAYKAAPELEGRRRLARELYPVRRIAEEIQNNPRLQDLHEYTAGDTTLSVVAVDAMGPILKEILSRVPQDGPTSPDGQNPGQGGPEQQQGGGGGQGQGQGQPQGGGGQGGGHNGQNPQQAGPGGGGGQPQPQGGQQQGGGGGQGGQPGQQQPQGQGPGGGGQSGQQGGNDPASGGSQQPEGGDEEGNGPPPPPEERMAEEGDGSEYDQDLDNGNQEFDADQDLEDDEAAWEQAWDAILDDLNLDRLANKALEAAQRDAEELDNLRKGIGLEDGVWAVMDPSERLALAEQLRTPEMKELATIIGRMKHFALGVKATRVTDVKHEAYDVELGNDFRRVLKPQMVFLAHAGTKYEFYRRYASKELLQFKMRGSENVAKGPIVMAIDKSGSMNGQPFHWALAVAEALRRFAADDDRDMYVMFFGNNRDRVRFSFPKGKAPFEQIMTFLGTVANGGTEFDGVLTEALKRAVEQFDGEGKEKADIVFVTDGMANLSDDWIANFNKERERAGVRMYSVYIGGSYDYGHTRGPLGLLDRISDACIPVSELKPESAEKIFQHV